MQLPQNYRQGLQAIDDTNASASKAREYISQASEYLNEQTVTGEGTQMLKELHSNDHFPEHIRRKYPHFLGIDITAGFQDQKTKEEKLIGFEILKIVESAGTGYYSYDWAKELELQTMRLVFETKLDRAVGSSKPNLMNERSLEATQLTQQTLISKEESQGAGGMGFFKRLLGRR